jgi:hypothetical protein
MEGERERGERGEGGGCKLLKDGRWGMGHVKTSFSSLQTCK